MAIFNEAYIEEWQNEQILQEMHFSKQDLQDPKTLDKILKRKENFESVLKYTDWLFAVAITIGNMIGSAKLRDIILHGKVMGDGLVMNKDRRVAQVIFALMESLSIILAKHIGPALKAMPSNQYRKNYDKYFKQINLLIEKMEKKKQEDPENAAEYQKVIDNCKAVLKYVEDKKKQEENEKFEGYVNQTIIDFNELKSWIKNPYMLGHTGNNHGNNFSLFLTPEVYGVNENKFIKACIDHMTGRSDFNVLFGDNENNINKFNGDTYYWVSSDDEYSRFITQKTKKLWGTDGDDIDVTSFYKVASDGYNKIKPNDPVLIEFDKRMGFYKFSECPENVKKKNFEKELFE